MDSNFQIFLSLAGLYVLFKVVVPLVFPSFGRLLTQSLSALTQPENQAAVAVEEAVTKMKRLKNDTETPPYKNDNTDAQAFALSLVKHYGVVVFHFGALSQDPADPGRITADMFDALEIEARWIDVSKDITLPLIFRESDGPQIWIGHGSVGDFLTIAEMAKDGRLREKLEKTKTPFNSANLALFENS